MSIENSIVCVLFFVAFALLDYNRRSWKREAEKRLQIIEEAGILLVEMQQKIEQLVSGSIKDQVIKIIEREMLHPKQIYPHGILMEDKKEGER